MAKRKRRRGPIGPATERAVVGALPLMGWAIFALIAGNVGLIGAIVGLACFVWFVRGLVKQAQYTGALLDWAFVATAILFVVGVGWSITHDGQYLGQALGLIK